MSELHKFPYTNYSTPACDCGDFFGMCRRAGVKLAVVGDSLQLLDKCNFVLSQVKIAIAQSALKDELGNDITAYIINAGTRGDTVVFTKGNGDEIIVEVPAATKATTDAEGQDITSYLRNLVVSGNKLRVTKGDGVSYEILCPFATVAETDINSKPITSYGAAIAVSGNDIILKDGLGNTISTITCHWSERAVADELGNNIRETYASDLVAGTTTIKLVSKAGDVLDEITVPYATSAHQSDSGSVFTHDFGASLVIDPLDNKSLDLLAEDGTLLNKVLVPFSTLSLDATNAIESVTISGNDIVFTTYGGVVTRIQSPYSVKSLNDGANNEITKTYVADVRQDSVTGEITFYDAEGTAICSLVPNSAHAMYDDMDNVIHDYIKNVIFDTQNDYFLFTKGSGDTLSVVCGYSTRAYKDLRDNAIHDTYIAFVTNVVDGDGEWVMVFYNGEGSEKFRIKVVANKAQKDAAGNVITDFYVHSLTISGDTISYNDANDTAIGSITLPKYVKDFAFTNGWLQLFDIDGNLIRELKVPVEDLLGLTLDNSDQIALTDNYGQDLNAASRIHLPEYVKSGEISGNNLLLKDIHGNILNTLALPAGGSYTMIREPFHTFCGNIIRDSNSNLVASAPDSYNLIDNSDTTKVKAKFLYYHGLSSSLPALRQRYSCAWTGTLNYGDELKIVRANTQLSSVIENYISNHGFEFGTSNAAYATLEQTGVEFDIPLSTSHPLDPAKAQWTAFNGSTAIAAGFTGLQAYPISTGVIFQATMSPSASFDSNTVLEGYQAARQLDRFGLLYVIEYADTDKVVYLNNPSVMWDGSYATGFFNGFKNAKLVKISKVLTDGTVASPSFQTNVSNGQFLVRTASCASNETNVVKITAYPTDSAVAGVGTLSIYYTFPTGKTIGTS